jgi:hypothetical protein
MANAMPTFSRKVGKNTGVTLRPVRRSIPAFSGYGKLSPQDLAKAAAVFRELKRKREMERRFAHAH